MQSRKHSHPGHHGHILTGVHHDLGSAVLLCDHELAYWLRSGEWCRGEGTVEDSQARWSSLVYSNCVKALRRV